MVHVGDKVRFLNDVGGGTVTSIINKKLVNVENEDGFEIPTLIKELVVIESSVINYEEEQAEPETFQEQPKQETFLTPQVIEGKDSPDFYLAFVPRNQQNPVGDEIEAWLVNDSNFYVLFQYAHFEEGQFKTVESGVLNPNSRVLLEEIAALDLSDFPAPAFQILYFLNESAELYKPIVKKLKINPVKFYKEKTFSGNEFFENNAWLLKISENLLETELDKLTEADVQKLISDKEREAAPVNKPIVRKRNKDLVEVDLHINELIDNTTGLSNKEMLDVQIGRFKSEMEDAIRNHVKRIVFIHGVGQGILKAEILRELKQHYRKYYVQDASFKEYGYGATMVILRRG